MKSKEKIGIIFIVLALLVKGFLMWNTFHPVPYLKSWWPMMIIFAGVGWFLLLKQKKVVLSFSILVGLLSIIMFGFFVVDENILSLLACISSAMVVIVHNIQVRKLKTRA